MEWIKTKSLFILSAILVLSLVVNIVGGWIIFKNGLKIEHKTFITTNTSSNSYANSGSLSLNILGQQQYWNGKFELKKEEFNDYEEAFKYAKSLNICNWEVAKIVPHKVVMRNTWGYGVWYQNFVTQTSEIKNPVIIKKEVKE